MLRRRTYIAGVVSGVTALVAGCSGADDGSPPATDTGPANSTATPTATETDSPTPAATETENSTSIDEILQPPGPGGQESTETATPSPES